MSTGAPGDTREREFQERLLAVVNEAKHYTRLGISEILEDIQRNGALQAAKKRLRSRDRSLPPIFQIPNKYFLAVKRVGRLDLSIESVILRPEWQTLFTPEEIDEAAETLSEYGFNLAPEFKQPGVDLVRADDAPAFARVRIAHPTTQALLEIEDRVFHDGEFTGCQATARVASELRAGQHPWPRRIVRKHLGICRICRDQYPDVTIALERFDQAALEIWLALLEAFQAALDLRDEKLQRFHLLQPEDYEEPGEYEIDLDVQLTECIRPVFAWRAVRVGCQLGRFMHSYAETFDEQGDLWLKLRSGQSQDPIGGYVRALDRELFRLGVFARHLLLISSWPEEDDGLLWAPTDGDLTPIENILNVDLTYDIEDWRDLLGEPPRSLNLLGILYLADSAAGALSQRLEYAPTAGKEREQLELQTIKDMFGPVQDAQAQALQRQDAIIDFLARLALQMEGTDRVECEQALLAEFSDTWAKLVPEVRSLLLASEQMIRTRGFAAPGTIVSALAAAFEVQLQHSVIAILFDHLKRRKVRSLKVPETWQDVEQRAKPLWSTSDKADKCTLGTMQLILRHPDDTVAEFFSQYGFDRLAIQDAIEQVLLRRNPAAHGRGFDVGTADQIRRDWFYWNRRRGGIYSAFFR